MPKEKSDLCMTPLQLQQGGRVTYKRHKENSFEQSVSDTSHVDYNVRS